MDTFVLKKLLRRQEGANLEFKRQWYELENPNPKKAEADKGEMIKDILSLANRNTNVAGEESYLVIGASNEIDELGNRELFDVVSTKPITRQRILDIVNPFCDPSIEDMLCEELLIDGKKLLVITILPSPHVHETIQKLKTAKVTYDKYTVFVRHAEGVRTASTKERIALQELKKLRFSETMNVPPISFGAFMGALFLGLLAPKLIIKEGDPTEKIISARIAGASVGAFMGGMVGSNYAQLKKIPTDWKQTSQKGKTIGSMALAAYGLGSWWLIRYWNLKRKKTN
jgi:hypothetical protein